MSADDSNENHHLKKVKSWWMEVPDLGKIVVRDGRVFVNGKELTDVSVTTTALDLMAEEHKKSWAVQRRQSLTERLIMLQLLRSIQDQRDTQAEDAFSFAPPAAGEQILYLLLPKKDREHIPGDLAEEATMLAERHGVKFAKRWYWKQVIMSVGPIFMAYVRRLVKLGTLVKLVEVVRSIF